MEDYILFSCDSLMPACNCIPSLYVDPTIFDWFSQHLKTKNYFQYVTKVWTITIRNVEFNELDVKLVQFKSRHEIGDAAIFNELKEFIKDILIETKLCMPWLPFKNLYFTHGDYNDQLELLESSGLWESVIEVSNYFLNWIIEIPLKLIKFEENAFVGYREILKNSIHRMQCAAYITCAYPWHQPWYINHYSYPTDYLALDICASVWKETDALQDFNMFDIISLDLAVCDANDYLNSYIERIFEREFKFIRKLQKSQQFVHFDLERYLFEKKRYDRIYFDLYLYFMVSYGENLKTVNWSMNNFKTVDESNRLYMVSCLKSIFPKITFQKNKFITLKSYNLMPVVIIKYIRRSQYSNIIINISNYKHFSATMLRDLLNCPSVSQIEINVDLVKYFSNDEINDSFDLSAGKKTICLYSKTRGGNEKIVENILKFLRQCKVIDLNASLVVVLNNCVIDNFEIFDGIILYSLAFQNMEINLTDLRKLCRIKQNLNSLYFIDCSNFGDYHLIKVLESKHFKMRRISIEDNHSVTINFYFMYAERYLMANQTIYFTIEDITQTINMKSFGKFRNLIFALNRKKNMIELKNRFNQTIDIYDLFWNTGDGDSSDRHMYDFYT